MIIGAMIAFDMGGPVNKVAFLFGSALIAEGNYANATLFTGPPISKAIIAPIIIASIIILAPCILFNQVVKYGRSSKQSSIFIWFSTDC
jgi:fructose-specific phosphotransferase system IIC component